MMAEKKKKKHGRKIRERERRIYLFAALKKYICERVYKEGERKPIFKISNMLLCARRGVPECIASRSRKYIYIGAFRAVVHGSESI